MRLATLCAVLLAVQTTASVSTGQSADEILKATGIQGGLVVQLGCDDGRLAAALGVGRSFIVQGLDTDPANVAKARANIQAANLGGRVSAELFDGQHLPYVNDLVNLIVAEDLGEVTKKELMRVLCPGGVAYVGRNGAWSKTVRPWPDDIDDWTHYLYDSQGTSVSADRIAGHPRGMRWTGGPFWARSHEHTASMQAMVSAAGRVFYVMDEGPTESIQLPSNLVLTARDAFNGTVLWKRPLVDWFNALYPLKSGPGWMPRRLVAVGSRVYISPGVGQDVLCLDAATGAVVCTYDGTATAFELIVSDGVVFAAVDPDMQPCDYNQQHADCWIERDRASIALQWDRQQDTRVVKALAADDGELLWQHKMPVAPMTLAVDNAMACLYDGSAVVAFDRQTGKELWKTDVLDTDQIRTGVAGPRLVIHGDRVLLSPSGNIVTMAAGTGEILWSVKGKPRSGHYSLEDFYVIRDKVWALGRQNNGVFVTYDLETGEQVDEFSNPIDSFYIHQRCYPGRATARVQLPPMMGIMVYDMEDDAWFNNHWVRGSCIYGVMPANGMVYATPHACACYYQSKLNGFNALAPDPQDAKAPAAKERLTKGPAYKRLQPSDLQPTASSLQPDQDWPVFRHDNKRSGYAATDVAAEVRKTWKKDFGTKLSQPVVAGGTLFTSAVDAHTVYALDAASGSEIWRFIAGGRVNSPPTIYRGLALFGCADGFVYALDAARGTLAWKFQAAPNDRKLISYGQVESVWPLSGSVLVQDDALYCVAGRSMFLDGGLRMIILNPVTGELVSENVMDRHVPGTENYLDDLVMGKHMPVSSPDILSSDGKHVYMKSQTFTLDGRRVRVRPQRPDTQYDEEVHLFSPISFLDDGWHQRAYWIYGRAAGEGWAEFQLPPKRVPCGRILCFDDKSAFGYGRDPELMCNTSVSEYRLYSAGKEPTRKVGIPKLEGTWVEGQYPADNPLAAHTVNWHQLSEEPKERLSAVDINWVHEEPDVMAKAMVLAGNHLFIAGPRDVADERQLWGLSNEEVYQEKMKEQAEWLEGTRGGVMQVYSKTDGTKLAEHELECLPAFDGLIAAAGSLFMATEDGSIVCFRGE